MIGPLLFPVKDVMWNTFYVLKADIIKYSLYESLYDSVLQ